MDVLLIALLTLLNGVFAMSEMALASSRKARLAAMAEDGRRRRRGGAEADGASDALPVHGAGRHHLHRHAQRHRGRGGVQRARWRTGCRASAWAPARPASRPPRIVVTIITFVTIIFGELVPKRIGQLYPETGVALGRAADGVAGARGRPLRASCCRPRRRPCSSCCRSTPHAARGMTEEEIAHSLEEGVDAGVIEQHEHQMVRTCSTWTTGR